MYIVYILKLENNQYYTGFTTDLEKRIDYHRKSFVKTTKRIKMREVVFYASFTHKNKAINFEKYLKSSSGYAFRNKRLV